MEGREDGQEHSLTVCTERLGFAGGRVHLRADQPVLIFSSTGWTPDEDFQIFLDAARQMMPGEVSPPPSVRSGAEGELVVVTGKWPQQAWYVERVALCTAWLEAADCPLLLGAADLGVCLHTSSSSFTSSSSSRCVS
ncbi:probable chitobiosyldiphosphodolichol beta-mannosyltransferase [Coccomyxa sp. Obi]|nr:probable chitobiosyldiphosphodolichol beta-mannosyltransferase [Coccomyxa sp. Obi]BDA41709.1 probable chitobiosyldiphosphodolichol beta-mannosyltransferase [Coccomyxa sp. Obi]BDA41715.1 probable chitobiosyldiphosphodolichol beta-mannosyltransferase [Coccomyxa sp. Obi]